MDSAFRLAELGQNWVQCAPQNRRLVKWLARSLIAIVGRSSITNEVPKCRRYGHMEIDFPFAAFGLQAVLYFRILSDPIFSR
jgi:hypothetical protein